MDELIFETRNKSRKHQIFISCESHRIGNSTPVYTVEFYDEQGIQLNSYHSFSRAREFAMERLVSYRKTATEMRDRALVKGLSIDVNRLARV